VDRSFSVKPSNIRQSKFVLTGERENTSMTLQFLNDPWSFIIGPLQPFGLYGFDPRPCILNGISCILKTYALLV
jgi:hypothetical protein